MGNGSSAAAPRGGVVHEVPTLSSLEEGAGGSPRKHIFIPSSPGASSSGSESPNTSDAENADPNNFTKGKATTVLREKLSIQPDGFALAKRKGGKRPPKDPNMSGNERLAQVLAQQQEHSGQIHLLHEGKLAEEGVVEEEVEEKTVDGFESPPLRRLRPKAPSSTGTPSSYGSASSLCSLDGQEAREPVTLRMFEILKVLGKGSHGKVYLVRHRGNGGLYAMKELKKADVIRSKQLENTKREFRVHRKLVQQEVQCPNITPLRFAFHSRSRLYMVFDYCAGGELYFHIGQRGRLPEALARFFGAQIALAIGYLHSNQVAYRDLKPENLLLDAEGNIHLVDLGLCKDNMSRATTGSSSFCGTVEYLAPEILNYQDHGLAVDWWSYGMVLYEMLTGLPPWYSYKQEEVVQGILKGDLKFPSHVSEDAKDLISGLLDRNPERRIGSQKGVEDLIDHPFFKKIDWVALARREVTPPFSPPCDPENLASNFDREFTSSKIQTEHDYRPPKADDAFGNWYFDCEDPLNC